MAIIHDVLEGDVIFTNHTINGAIGNTNHTINGDVVCNGARAMPSYDGSYIVTPTKEIQILATNNLRMTDDVTINPIPSNYFDTSDATATANSIRKGFSAYGSNGKINGTYVQSWMGDGAEFVSTVYDQKLNLSNDTTFNSWTASTTAGSIKASATAATYAADMGIYDYLLLWSFDIQVATLSGATLKAMPIRESTYVCQQIFKRPSSSVNIVGKVFDGNACVTLATAPYLRYYNTNGSVTYTWANSYGIYPTVQAATFSNATSDTPTITLKTPIIYARCSTTYFATGRKAQIDSDNTDIILKGELYRTKKDTSPLRCMYDQLVNIIDA